MAFAAFCVQVAKEFLDGCSQSLVEACRRERVPWEVTTCGWSEDEEQDRITRYLQHATNSAYLRSGHVYVCMYETRTIQNVH